MPVLNYAFETNSAQTGLRMYRDDTVYNDLINEVQPRWHYYHVGFLKKRNLATNAETLVTDGVKYYTKDSNGVFTSADPLTATYVGINVTQPGFEYTLNVFALEDNIYIPSYGESSVGRIFYSDAPAYTSFLGAVKVISYTTGAYQLTGASLAELLAASYLLRFTSTLEISNTVVLAATALEPRLVLTADPDNANLVTVTDATGERDESNVTGYGDGNTERSALKVGLLVDRRNRGERFPVPVRNYPFTADENTVNNWQVTLPQDAVYDYLYIAALPFDNSVPQPKDRVMFNLVDKKFYKAIQNTYAPTDDSLGTDITDTNYWQPILTVADFPLTAPFSVVQAYVGLVQKAHTYNSESQMAVRGADFGKGCGCEDTTKAFDYATLLMWLQSVQLNEGFDDYVAAENAVDHLAELLNQSKPSCACGSVRK